MLNPINKTIPVSDLQRRAKTVFEEISKSSEPIIVLNKNKPVSVMMSPEVYEEIIDRLADIQDLADVLEDEKNYDEKDYISFEEFKKYANSLKN